MKNAIKYTIRLARTGTVADPGTIGWALYSINLSELPFSNPEITLLESCVEELEKGQLSTTAHKTSNQSKHNMLLYLENTPLYSMRSKQLWQIHADHTPPASIHSQNSQPSMDSNLFVWLAWADQYFTGHKVPNTQKFPVAFITMEGPSLPWMCWLQRQSPTLTQIYLQEEFLEQIQENGRLLYSNMIR
ncbi:DNA mismatch repair protein MutL [Striga asiatica]|uniref:DNA mismatch repair protein MutL n=1 Tax=Striga asiatica TaxID=4170 RepID=A0A5A7PVD0_STRAF|nr:DNA mismatch repair protein MutL [Striga asiatica]